MKNIQRGRGSRRGIHFCAAAALGLALSGCGGGGGSSGAAPTAQSSTPTPLAVPAQSPSTSSSTPANTSAPPTASAGVVTINWTPPTENVDNTPLTNLAGYDIHYGTSSGEYTKTVSVDNPGIATYVVQNLSPGTYYFAVSAVNSQGTESPLSAEVSATVN